MKLVYIFACIYLYNIYLYIYEILTILDLSFPNSYSEYRK